MTTTRTAHDGSTPKTPNFPTSARDHVTFIPAPRSKLPQRDSLIDRLQNGTNLFIKRGKGAIGNNTGMLLVAASQVRDRAPAS